MYSKIIGVDPSLTDTGIVLIRKDGEKWVTNTLVSTANPELFDPERQLAIVHALNTVIIKALPSYENLAVVMEDHSYGSFQGKAKTRAELVGMLKYVILQCNISLFMVSPMSLKKFMGCSDKKDKGNKDAMFIAASRKFGFVHTNNNIVDAYCLARYLAANREGQMLPLDKL